MENSHVLSALLNKHSEIIGLINYHKKEVKTLIETLNHINKTIKVFDPKINLSHLKGKIYHKYNTNFKNGELSRLILTLLKDSSKPLTINEITNLIETQTGITNISEMSVRNCLNRYAKKEITQKINEDDYRKTWILNKSLLTSM